MIPTLKTLPDADKDRHVGVEVELGGLSPETVARTLKERLGGTVRDDGSERFVLDGTEYGEIEIYLDTRFRKGAETWLHKAGMDLAQLVVPVEIVTPPILPSDLPDLDAAMGQLAAQGATGTAHGLLLGFGVHLNVEIATQNAPHIGSVLTAFALLEPLLRAVIQIDISRRVLPFISAYPEALVDRLVAQRGCDLETLMALYLDENPTRNSGLDMLPIFAQIDPDTVAARVDDGAVSARPAYHYRLPDCRLDEAGWSISREWNRWTVIEQAAQSAVLDDLCRGWLDHRAKKQEGHDWAEAARQLLAAHNLEIPA